MKNLVIQNNLPDIILKKGDDVPILLDNPQTLIGENYNFEINLYNDIEEKLKTNEYGCVIVHLNLNSNNCLNLNGLDVAYSIRLSPELNHQFVPIIILGSIDLEIVLRLNSKANILLTPGIYYKNISSEGLEFIDNTNWKSISKEDFDEFLDRIEIKAPSNYQSHHSIANEWSILRWAEALNISNDPALDTVKQKIDGLLFFRYLKSKYPTHPTFEIPNFIIEEKISVLYIDDEWEKGWDFVLDNFFNRSNDITFKTFKKEYKSLSKNNIIKECEAEISNSPLPDILLLDLRLSDQDFNSRSTELTGYKILQKIKGYFDEDKYFVAGINPGIQVIIFTASNKVWNLTDLLLAGADGFILKESPELGVNSSYVKDGLKSFVTQLKICVTRKFLKPFYESIKTIKNELKKSLWHDKHSPEQQLAITAFEGFVISMMESAFDILHDINFDSRKNKLRQAFLFLYQILEEYVKLDSIYFPGINNLSSKVLNKDLTSVDVFGPDKSLHGNIICNITFKKGRYSFQTKEADQTITSVFFKKETFNPRVNPKSQISETSLFKIINVYKERHRYSENECSKIIELTYLRSNLCGHMTGNIDSNKRDIDKEDILELISLIVSITK